MHRVHRARVYASTFSFGERNEGGRERDEEEEEEGIRLNATPTAPRAGATSAPVFPSCFSPPPPFLCHHPLGLPNSHVVSVRPGRGSRLWIAVLDRS